VDGNIGYYGLARSGPARPRRHPAGAGLDQRVRWRGYLHESEWPSAYNPSRGYLVSANNKVASDSFPFMLGSELGAPHRAPRASSR
jgi:penicillin amidase